MRVVNEDLSGMSLAEVASSCTEERARQRLAANFVLRHSGLERGGDVKRHSPPFPLSPCPTEAEISLSLEAERGQLGQTEEPEAPLDEYIQEAGFEA